MAKNYLPFDDECFDKILEDAFAEDAEVHVFSDRYLKRKEKLMKKNMNNAEKKPIMRKKSIIAMVAAAAVVVAVPTSVYAGSRIYNAYMTETAPYQRDIIIDAGESPNMDIKALNVGWVPNDFKMHCGEEHTALMKYKADTEEMRGISVLFWKIPMGDTQFQDTVMGAVESSVYTDTNGNSVVLIGYDNHLEFQEKRYEAWVAFKDTPYVAQVYIMGDVSDEERTNILENLSLESWDTEVAGIWEPNNTEESIEYYQAESKVDISSMTLAKVGDTLTDEYEMEEGKYCVSAKINDIRIQNTFDGITTDSFNAPYDYSEYMNPDGTVKDNIRTWYKYGNGIDTLSEEIRKDTMAQSIVVLDVTYKNIGDIDLGKCICPTVELIDKDGNLLDVLHEQEDTDYNDSMGDLKTDNMMFSIKSDHVMSKNNLEPFNAGDAANVQIAFLVNTEDLPNMYIKLMPTGVSINEEIDRGTSFIDLSYLADEVK